MTTTHRKPTPRIAQCIWLMVCALIASASDVTAAEKILFKPVTHAILKMDEKPLKTWEVYRGEKHAHLVLVRIGRRFLLLDIKARELFELDPSTLQRKNDELRWEDLKERAAEPQTKNVEPAGTETKKALLSEDWTFRSVGPLMIVKVRLAAEGRILEVQLPQRPDLRWAY